MTASRWSSSVAIMPICPWSPRPGHSSPRRSHPSTRRGSGLNKEVSELCDMLVAFRTPGPLDQDRIKDWLDANVTREQRDQVMSQLAGLRTGTAIFASGHPGLKVFSLADVRAPRTFDS